MRVLSIAAVLLFIATPSVAQITVKPAAGYMFADKPLGLISETHRAELNSSIAFGLSVEMPLSIPTLSLRGSFLTTHGADVARRPALMFGPCEFCSDELTSSIGTANMMNISASAVWRFVSAARVRPYVLGGVGLKRLEVARYTQTSLRQVDSSTRSAIHAGVGLNASVGRFSLEFEAVDYLSGLWDDDKLEDSLTDTALNRTRHDIGISAGLRIRLW